MNLANICVNAVCVNVNEKFNNVNDCKMQGDLIKSMLDENNIRKYIMFCVDANEYEKT
jgi:hypothetical protein